MTRTPLILAFALSSAANAQNPGDSTDRAAVERVAQAVFHAAHVADTATLNRLYASDYVMVLPNGARMARHERLAEVAAGGRHGAVSRLSVDNIRIHGDVAVLFGHVAAWDIDPVADPGMRHDSPPPSRQPDRQYRFFEVLLRSPSGWRVSIVQTVPVRP